MIDSPATRYARWCVEETEGKAPRYVKLQAEQWLSICEGNNPEAEIDAKAYRRICKLLRVMRHPDLGCSMYDGLEPYAWLLIVATLCTRCKDGTRYYETAVLEIARAGHAAGQNCALKIII